MDTKLASRLLDKVELSEQLSLVPVGDRESCALSPFFDHLDHRFCWLWTGGYSKKPRGQWAGPPRPVIWFEGRVEYAFRLMLHLRDGVPLAERKGLQACHEAGCDNPSCINPYHGYWGTQQQNHRYRMTRAPETFRRRNQRDSPCPPYSMSPAVSRPTPGAS